jgi:hypothetical protein
LQRKQSVLRSKERGSRERRRRNLHNFSKNRQRLTQKSCRTEECLKNSKNLFKFVKDCCRRQNRLKISRNRSNLSKIVAENEEFVKFFQIFERFTIFSSTGGIPSNSAKIVSNTQGTSTKAVRFILRTDPRRETSSEGNKKAWNRRKHLSRQILRRGPTAVGSARKCTRFNPLERTEDFWLEKSRRHLDRPSRDTWRDPIPSQNRESGVGRAKETALQKLRYAISRNPEKTCKPSISEDRWQQINAPSAYRHSGFQAVKET